jgi:16S rRNA (guanine527-N7)-methyltransferase
VTAAAPRVAAAASERDRPEIAAAVDSVFADREPVAARYAALLATEGITRGMIGPREADRIWERHLLNSAAAHVLIPPGSLVVDLGSGAGLPGIPLAIARPDLTVVLLEPMLRRVAFLTECVETLALPGLSVRRGRAQDGLERRADVVVARAVAPLEQLVKLSAPLVTPGGTLLALKGRAAAAELADLSRHSTLQADLVGLPAPGQAVTVIRISWPVQPRVGAQARKARGQRR